MLGDRVSYLNIKFHSCTLTIIYSISLSSDFKISDNYYTFFLSLSDCITVSIGIADCSSLKYSLTCKCEKGTEQKGAGIRWWLIVRDVMWCQPPFSQLSWVFVFSLNVLARSLTLTSATQKPFQEGMIKTETNVAVALLSWVLGCIFTVMAEPTTGYTNHSKTTVWLMGSTVRAVLKNGFPCLTSTLN